MTMCYEIFNGGVFAIKKTLLSIIPEILGCVLEEVNYGFSNWEIETERTDPDFFEL